jgi:hypothetical protein
MLQRATPAQIRDLAYLIYALQRLPSTTPGVCGGVNLTTRQVDSSAYRGFELNEDEFVLSTGESVVTGSGTDHESRKVLEVGTDAMRDIYESVSDFTEWLNMFCEQAADEATEIDVFCDLDDSMDLSENTDGVQWEENPLLDLDEETGDTSKRGNLGTPRKASDGTVCRVVPLPDGSGRLETWSKSGGWVKGGGSLADWWEGRVLTAEEISALGTRAELILVKGETDKLEKPGIPRNAGGVICRKVKLPEGGSRLESWTPKGGWVKGGPLDWSDFFVATVLTPAEIAELGC